jgi:hypothetical protein
MARFRYWRKMTWVLLIWGAVMVFFVVSGGFGPATIALALAGLIGLGLMWFMTRPLWRQGRGLHLRRPQYVHVPFKNGTTPQEIS